MIILIVFDIVNKIKIFLFNKFYTRRSIFIIVKILNNNIKQLF